MTKFLINIDDGRIVFRNQYTDEQVNLKPIPDEIIGMLHRGEVTKEDVLAAIGLREKENGLDLHNYINERKKLNVRTANPQTADTAALADRSEDTISVSEVVATKAKPKASRKSAVKKVTEAVEKAEDKKESGGDFFSSLNG